MIAGAEPRVSDAGIDTNITGVAGYDTTASSYSRDVVDGGHGPGRHIASADQSSVNTGISGAPSTEPSSGTYGSETFSRDIVSDRGYSGDQPTIIGGSPSDSAVGRDSMIADSGTTSGTAGLEPASGTYGTETYSRDVVSGSGHTGGAQGIEPRVAGGEYGGNAPIQSGGNDPTIIGGSPADMTGAPLDRGGYGATGTPGMEPASGTYNSETYSRDVVSDRGHTGAGQVVEPTYGSAPGHSGGPAG